MRMPTYSCSSEVDDLHEERSGELRDDAELAECEALAREADTDVS